MKGRKLSKVFLLVLLLLFSRAIFAAISVNAIDTLGAEESPMPADTLPLQKQLPKPQLELYPAINLWGFVGRYETVKGQLLWPVCGDNVDSAFFGLGEFSNANKDSGYMLGMGGVYRKVINQSHILGFYLIGDLDSSTNSRGYIVANPGVEFLGSILELRLNGYLPMGVKDNWYQGSYRNAKGEKYGWVEEVGPGYDFEFGGSLPYLSDVKAFLDTYTYVTQNTDNPVGYGGRLEYNFSRYLTFELRAMHDDDLKNFFLVGARVTIGGFSSVPKHQPMIVAAKLADPVQHNLSAIGTGYGIRIQNQYINP